MTTPKVPVADRPKFKTAWGASLRIYPERFRVSHPNDEEVLEHVAKTIGGYVFANICKEFNGKTCSVPTAWERDNVVAFRGKWPNTCAVRLSYILNYSGWIVPKSPAKTVTGGDKYQYFFRVDDVIDYLTHEWGEPEDVGADGAGLKGRKGLLIVEVPWSDATGHATLYDGEGAVCYDDCHFDAPPTSANFWELP